MTEETFTISVAAQGAAIVAGSFNIATTDADRLHALGNIKRDFDEAKATDAFSRNFPVDEKYREARILLRHDDAAPLAEVLKDGDKLRAKIADATEAAREKSDTHISLTADEAQRLIAAGEVHFEAALSTAKIAVAKKRGANAGPYEHYHHAARVSAQAK